MGPVNPYEFRRAKNAAVAMTTYLNTSASEIFGRFKGPKTHSLTFTFSLSSQSKRRSRFATPSFWADAAGSVALRSRVADMPIWLTESHLESYTLLHRIPSRIPRFFSGILLDWNPIGIPLESQWNPIGIPGESHWNPRGNPFWNPTNCWNPSRIPSDQFLESYFYVMLYSRNAET